MTPGKKSVALAAQGGTPLSAEKDVTKNVPTEQVAKLTYA